MEKVKEENTIGRFAFNIGLVTGALTTELVIGYLKKRKVTDDEIKNLLTALEPIRRGFYNEPGENE